MSIDKNRYKWAIFLLAILCVLASMLDINRFHVWQQISDGYNLELKEHNNFWDKTIILNRQNNPQEMNLNGFKQLLISDKMDLTKSEFDNITKSEFDNITKSEFDNKYTSTLALIPRFVLMQPIVFVSNITGINIDLIFSLTVITLIFLSWRLIILATHQDNYKRQYAWELALLLAIILASFTMNGRMFWAFTGSAILLFIHFKNPINLFYLFSLLVMSLWFCDVSTGAFIVTYISLFFWSVFFYKPKERIILSRAVCYLPLLIAFPFFLDAINKNLHFFGGGLEGIMKMLYVHGIGGFIINNLFMISIVFTIVAYIILHGLKKFPYFRFPILMTILGIVGGAFGFSTMIVMMPALGFLFLKALQGPAEKEHLLDSCLTL